MTTGIKSTFLFLLISTLLSLSANAGVWLTQSGKIKAVTSGYTNDPAVQRFYIRLTEATAVCAADEWIMIDKSFFGANESSYESFRAIALAAQVSQKTVWVYNHPSNDCTKATWISIQD